jgi:hypothetical protein
MSEGLRKLARREQDIRQFDINTISDHDDPNADALRDRYNDTIASVFGEDTQQYQQYSINDFEISNEPLVMSADLYGGPRGPNIPKIRENYTRGIQKALMHSRSSGKTRRRWSLRKCSRRCLQGSRRVGAGA